MTPRMITTAKRMHTKISRKFALIFPIIISINCLTSIRAYIGINALKYNKIFFIFCLLTKHTNKFNLDEEKLSCYTYFVGDKLEKKEKKLKNFGKVFSLGASFGITLGCFVGSIICIKSTIKSEEKTSKVVEIVQPYEHAEDFEAFQNQYVLDVYKEYKEGRLTDREFENKLEKPDACLVEYGANKNIISFGEKEDYYKNLEKTHKGKIAAISLVFGEVVGDILFLTANRKYEKKEEGFVKE